MPRKKSETTLKLEAIAARCGFSEKHLRQLHTKQAMPLELDAALRWLEARPSADDVGGDTSSTSALRRERVRLVKLQAQKIQADLEIQRGKFISRDEVIEAFTKIASAMNAGFRKLEGEVPQKLLGLPLEKSKPAAKALIRELQGQLATAESVFWSAHPEREA